MATLEALENLYQMGFIIEEEYLARRAAFGAPPPEPVSEVPVSTNAVEDNTQIPYNTSTYDSYTSSYTQDTYAAPVEPTSQYDINHHTATTSNDTYSNTSSNYNYAGHDTGYYATPSYETPSSYVDISSVTIAAPETDSFNSSAHSWDTSAPTIISATANDAYIPSPASSLAASGVQTSTKTGPDGETYGHIFSNPVPDNSEVGVLHRPIPSDKALIVHRTIGTYAVFTVAAGVSSHEALKEASIGDHFQLIESGTTEIKTEDTMYWKSTYYVDAKAVSKVEPGHIYVTRAPKKGNHFSSGSTFDERVVWRYYQSKHPKAYSYDEGRLDIFLPPTRIPDLRLMSDSLPSSAFDPRQVVDWYKSKLDPYTMDCESGGVTTGGKIRLQSKPTPTFLLWPLFIHQLRSLQSKVPEKFTYNLPQDSATIWARINDCLNKNVCYFTGETAASGSFLGQDLHNEHIATLFEKIKAENQQPTGIKIGPNAFAVLPSSTSTSSSYSNSSKQDTQVQDEHGERIKYDDPTMRFSYGWPTQADNAGASTPCKVPGVKPISARRTGCVEELVSQLSMINGPAPEIDTRVAIN